ncbi:MAG TPA: hypothetical protein VFT12_10420, partial [Thermoanaerobaculia bacterium]|nr:hypothetical protein [Thermoanaerobaculia bacterium]
HARVGHLLQGRPDVRLIDKETYSLEVLRYVVLNPVRAGMTATPDEYEWSSYRSTAGIAVAPDWLAVDDVLAAFSPERSMSQHMYRDFVYAGIGVEAKPWDRLVGQIYLGSESWLEKMRDQVLARPRDCEHPQAQRFLGRPSMTDVVASVAGATGIDPIVIRRARGGRPRLLAAWLGCYEAELPLSAIAAGLGLRNSGHVSTLIRACDQKIAEDEMLRDARDRCLQTLRGVAVTSEP